MLNEDEVAKIKRIFVLYVNSCLNNKEEVLCVSDIYKKLINRDLKTDWTEWNTSICKILKT